VPRIASVMNFWNSSLCENRQPHLVMETEGVHVILFPYIYPLASQSCVTISVFCVLPTTRVDFRASSLAPLSSVFDSTYCLSLVLSYDGFVSTSFAHHLHRTGL
jgi:hypothetical protein